MSYFLKLMGGEKFTITDDEFKQVANAKGAVLIKSVGSWINMSSVAAIYPEKKADDIEDRKQLTRGVLHDGTRVRRHFGRWIVADSPDDDPVKLDPQYYPEVALDKVFSEKDFERIKGMSEHERLLLLTEGDDRFDRLEKNHQSDLKKLDFKS